MPVTDAAPSALADLPESVARRRRIRRRGGRTARRRGRHHRRGLGLVRGAGRRDARRRRAGDGPRRPRPPGDVDAWADDLASFTGRRPAVFPACETWPPDRPAFDDAAGRRLRLLQQLAADPPQLLADHDARADAAGAGPRRPGRPRPAASASATRSTWTSSASWLVAHGYKRRGRRRAARRVLPPRRHLRRLLARRRRPGRGSSSSATRSSRSARSRPASQRSLGELTEVTVLRPRRGTPTSGGRGHLARLPPADSWVALVEPADLHEQGKHFLERVADVEGLFTVDGTFRSSLSRPTVTVSALPRPGVEARGPPARRVGRAVQRQRPPRPRRTRRRRPAATAC